MSDEGYVREKFAVAVDALATGIGPIQERVADAFGSGLYLLGERELPEDRRADFARLRGALITAESSGDMSAWTVSARRLDDEEARSLAKLIVEIDADLQMRAEG